MGCLAPVSASLSPEKGGRLEFPELIVQSLQAQDIFQQLAVAAKSILLRTESVDADRSLTASIVPSSSEPVAETGTSSLMKMPIPDSGTSISRGLESVGSDGEH
jgi:hypothetical protein